MKFYVLLVAFFFATVTSYSQENKGYYVTNGDVRINGYFKSDNFSNPNDIEFRKDDSESFEKLELQTIKEYGINNHSRVIKKTVEVDRSRSSSVKFYSNFKDPDWQKETLFLNMIVDGDASLYSCVYNGENKFFYEINSKQIRLNQLVFKKYVFNNNDIKENTTYKQDLYNNARCDDSNINFSSLNYAENSLKKVFVAYNECHTGNYAVYENKGASKIEFSVSGYAGATFNMLATKTQGGSSDDSCLGFNIGAEVAVIMPSSNLGGFFRLEYAMLSELKTITPSANTHRLEEESKLDVSYFSIVLGPRYYFNKNKKGFFIDAGFGMGFASGDLVKTQYGTGEYFVGSLKKYDLAHNFYLSVGFGYALSDKMGVEVRYDTPREVVDYNSNYKFSKLGLNFKYTFL
ncbi:outer membrane beta-barrel protein [Flavobacterium sp.]|uniref:outer membrane beta-barrel protein n=1 Tax=Flavobacterium sp. TaxID=239 RepID=UPI003A95B908